MHEDRTYNRPRIPRAVTDGWQSIKITSFEQVPASASTSLLRLSGKAARSRVASQRPQLVLDSDGRRYRYAALPAPDDPRGTLQAAYSLPSALIGSESTFWLEHPDGSLTELPRPAAGQSRAGDTTAPRDGADALQQELDRLRDRLGGMTFERDELSRRAANAEAERRQLSATLEELEIWREELERRLTATTDELAAQATEIELLVAELASVRAELARHSGAG
jgi:hypothetical protein